MLDRLFSCTASVLSQLHRLAARGWTPVEKYGTDPVPAVMEEGGGRRLREVIDHVLVYTQVRDLLNPPNGS